MVAKQGPDAGDAGTDAHDWIEQPHHHTAPDSQRAWGAIEAALELVPACGLPGHRSPTGLALVVADIVRPFLTLQQRRIFAAGLMLALDPGTAEKLAEAALYDLRAGVPVPPFTTLRDEARDWASIASLGELRAYLGACWNHLSQGEQSRFLSAVRPKRRAA